MDREELERDRGEARLHHSRQGEHRRGRQDRPGDREKVGERCVAPLLPVEIERGEHHGRDRGHRQRKGGHGRKAAPRRLGAVDQEEGRVEREQDEKEVHGEQDAPPMAEMAPLERDDGRIRHDQALAWR